MMMDEITDKREREFRAEVALDSYRRLYAATNGQPLSISQIITGT